MGAKQSNEEVLFRAVEAGSSNKFEEMMKNEEIKVDINKKVNALYVACGKGRIGMVEGLLATFEEVIDVNMTTPLHNAVKRKQYKIVRRLMKHPGLDINRTVTNKRDLEEEKRAKELLKKWREDRAGETKKSKPKPKKSKKKKADSDDSDSDDSDSEEEEEEEGEGEGDEEGEDDEDDGRAEWDDLKEYVESIGGIGGIGEKFSSSDEQEQGETALHCAVGMCDLKMVKLLLGKFRTINFEIQDDKDLTVIQLAKKNPTKEIYKLLLGVRKKTRKR